MGHVKMIIENVYNSTSILPPTIQPKILEKLIFTCIPKIPFYDSTSNWQDFNWSCLLRILRVSHWKIHGSCQRAKKKKTKKTVEHESDIHTSFSWCLWNSPQRTEKETDWWKLEIKERINIIQTTALSRRARMCRKVLKIWGNKLSLKIQLKLVQK